MSDYFPLEVIEEILQRLPVKSVVRYMCVCKSWKSIITNDSFIVSHHQRLQSNPTNSSLFFHLCTYADEDDDNDVVDEDDLYCDDEDDDSGDDATSTELKGDLFSLYSDNDATDSLSVFKFPPVNKSHGSSTVFGTCNGLVCIANRSFSVSDYDQAVIWNPSLFKYLILPKPSITFKTPSSADYGFGFDSCNQDFKVVRFVSSFHGGNSQYEIYSLAAHSWRSMTVAPFPFRVGAVQNKLFNGVLHWLANSTDAVPNKLFRVVRHFILTFDFSEEKFGKLMLPNCLKGAPKEWEWFIFRGCNLLALQHNTGSPSEHRCRSTNIWVMKEYGVVESWTRVFHFDWTRYNGDLQQSVLTLRNNDEVVLTSSDEEITFLHTIKGLEKKIRHISSYVSFVEDHVESLFLINDKKAKTYLPL